MKAKKEKKERVIEDRFKKIDFKVTPIPVKEDNIFKGIKLKETAKQRNKHLEDLIHPDLLAMENVTLAKYENNKFKRGLDDGEHPFPVTPRIAPYVVKDPVPGAKQYRWCSCGMSRKQPF